MDITEARTHVEGTLTKLMKETVPVKRWCCSVKGRKPLWMNDTALRKVGFKKSYLTYLQTREGKYYLEYCKVRNQVKKSCKRAIREFEKQIAAEPKNNPKAFYVYACSKLKTKDGIGHLDDGTATGDEDKAKVLNDSCCSVVTQECFEDLPNFEDKNFQEALIDISFT